MVGQARTGRYVHGLTTDQNRTYLPAMDTQRGARSDTPPEAWVDYEEVARFLGVSAKSVYRLVRRKNDPLPAVRVGGQIRFRYSEVVPWAERQRPKVAS
jgi:excisionase family DNA binding protein